MRKLLVTICVLGYTFGIALTFGGVNLIEQGHNGTIMCVAGLLLLLAGVVAYKFTEGK